MYEHMRPAGAFDFYIHVHAEDDNPPNQALIRLEFVNFNGLIFVKKLMCDIGVLGIHGG